MAIKTHAPRKGGFYRTAALATTVAASTLLSSGCHTVPYTFGGVVGGARTMYTKSKDKGPITGVAAGVGGAVGGLPIGFVKGVFYDICYVVTGEIHTDDIMYPLGKQEPAEREWFEESTSDESQEENNGPHSKMAREAQKSPLEKNVENPAAERLEQTGIERQDFPVTGKGVL